MRYMNWDSHLSHFQTDKSKLKLIISLQQGSTSEKGHLTRLTTAMWQYIQLRMRICRQHNQSFIILKTLFHSRNIPSGW
jgi:hypothetical protein